MAAVTVARCHGLRLRFIRSYRPQTAGNVERAIRVLQNE